MVPRLTSITFLLLLIIASGLPLHLQAQNNGPGGLYKTSASSSLVCWVNIPRQAAEYQIPVGTLVNKALDYSFTRNHFQVGTGVPLASYVNNTKSLLFNSSHYLEAPYTSAFNSTIGNTVIVVTEPTAGTDNQAVISMLDESGSTRKGFALRVRTATEFWSGDGSSVASGSYLGEGSTAGSRTGLRINAGIIGIVQTISHNYGFFRVTLNGLYSRPLNSVFRLGADNRSTPTDFFKGHISEVIVFNKPLPTVELIILHNYLAAKYNLSLPNFDYYTWDQPAKGDFDYDVAGVGVYSGVRWSDSKGTGMVSILGGGSTNNFLLWGHNNASLNPVITDLPVGIQTKLGRTWGVNSVGATGVSGVPLDYGFVHVTFDLHDFKDAPIIASDLRLLIDHDGDRIYNEPGTIQVGGALDLGGEYMFMNVKFPPGATTFTLGSVSVSTTPLPVVLKEFRAQSVNNNVAVNWTTLTEAKASRFEVERAIDAKTWTSVGEVAAVGNSSVLNHYSLVDETAPRGRLYYRLIQYDFEGDSTTYPPTMIDHFPEIDLPYPNPARPGATVRVPTVEGSPAWELFTATGTKVETQKSNQGIDLPESLTSGIYILKNAWFSAKSYKLQVME